MRDFLPQHQNLKNKNGHGDRQHIDNSAEESAAQFHEHIHQMIIP